MVVNESITWLILLLFDVLVFLFWSTKHEKILVGNTDKPLPPSAKALERELGVGLMDSVNTSSVEEPLEPNPEEDHSEIIEHNKGCERNRSRSARRSETTM